MAKKQDVNPNIDVDWLDIVEGTPIANFKETNTLILKFIDNGFKKTETIQLKEKDKEGNPIQKEITTVKYSVIDLLDSNTEKIFNSGSKRAIDSLKALLPLTDKECIRIDRIGSGYNTRYKAKAYTLEMLADYINLSAKELTKEI